MNNNLNLQQSSILTLFLGINLTVLTPIILQASKASEQPENIKKVPRDVISTHFFNDLSARDILNFGQSCKKFKEIGDNHKTVILAKEHYKMLNQEIDQIAATPDEDPLPQTYSLNFYSNMFDKEMEKYKESEKNKIMRMNNLSSREKQILLQKLAVRLIFIKRGHTCSGLKAADAATASAMYSAAPYIQLPLVSSLGECGHNEEIYQSDDKHSARTDAEFAWSGSTFLNLIEAMNCATHYLSKERIVNDLKNISTYTTANILGNEVARITSIFFSTEQGKLLTNNNENPIKVGRLAWQIAQLEANRIISTNAASYIKNLGLKLDEIIKEDTQLPPFDNRKSFLIYLENNRLFQEYMTILKKRNSTYLINQAMEIIASVFDF